MQLFDAMGMPIKMEADDIEHHGIKGQKWGVRRYQNPDGSLTPEGQKRYEKGLTEIERSKTSTNDSRRKVYKKAIENYEKQLRSGDPSKIREAKRLLLKAERAAIGGKTSGGKAIAKSTVAGIINAASAGVGFAAGAIYASKHDLTLTNKYGTRSLVKESAYLGSTLAVIGSSLLTKKLTEDVSNINISTNEYYRHTIEKRIDMMLEGD